MDNTNPMYLYVGSAVFIVLVIILIAQACRRKSKKPGTYVAMDTPKGLVNVPKDKAIAELSQLRDKLYDNVAGASDKLNRSDRIIDSIEMSNVLNNIETSDKCHELSFLIDESMRELKTFIDKNPYNAEALCTLEMKSDVLSEYLEDSINPNPVIWEDTYKTLLEWEDNERNMTLQEKFKYLLKNLDMLIALLRSDVCDYGRIDLVKLYNILNATSENICKTGQQYTPLNELKKINDVDEVRVALESDKRLIEPMAVSEAREISYKSEQRSSEPGESREYLHRSKPSHEAFGSINEVPYAMYKYNVNDGSNNSDTYNRTNIANYEYNEPKNTITNTILYAANRTASKLGYGTSDGLTRLGVQPQNSLLTSHLDKKENGSGAVMPGDYEIAEDVNNYSELIGQATVINRAINYHGKKRGSTLLDPSLEGLVERDILGYTPPGHLIRKLYDASDHYTVNVNSCLGKTIPDDELWSQCTNQDMKYLNALNGDATGMIAGL